MSTIIRWFLSWFFAFNVVCWGLYVLLHRLGSIDVYIAMIWNLSSFRSGIVVCHDASLNLFTLIHILFPIVMIVEIRTKS